MTSRRKRQTTYTRMPAVWRDNMLAELRFFVRSAQAPRIRGILEFAENDVVIPEGRYEGTRFRTRTLPYTKLFLDEVDSGRWRRHIVTGCVQGGKTFVTFVLPTLWHLFEWGEPAICGVPSMDIAGDKWRKELLPTINASPKFRRELPQTGKGSKGGPFEAIRFRNGAELKFMSGHGGDEKRSHFTARIVSVTEADRVDESGERSREAAPIYQLEARTSSYADDARLYAECTTTTEAGYINHQYQTASSASRILCPCPHCGEWVCPEREHLVGYEDAETELAAAELATWGCPACGECIGEDERRTMNRDCRLVHRGQTIDDDGEVQGDLPSTITLGFRWNAFNNLLWSTGYIAQEEWIAQHSRDKESVEKKMRQWFWALPHEPSEFDVTPLDSEVVAKRIGDNLPRGLLPADSEHVTMGIDIGKHKLHWTLIAWLPNARGHVTDYGVVGVKSKDMSVERAIVEALDRLNDTKISTGWACETGKQLAPGWVFVDAGYATTSIMQFCRKANAAARRFLPSFGYGASQHSRGFRTYRSPTKTTATTSHIGENYHINYLNKHRMHAVHVNSDHWKTWVHERLDGAVTAAGSITLFNALAGEHRQFAQHLTAERLRREIVPGKGEVDRWFNETGRQNHFLDSTYLACAAGHLCGVRIVDEEKRIIRRPTNRRPAQVQMPDGRPFLITER